MKKIITDLLCENGKFSRKSVSGAMSLLFAYGYVLLVEWYGAEPKEWVFNGALLYAATALGMTVISKIPSMGGKKNEADTN